MLTSSLGSVNTPYWAENYAQVSAGTAGWQDVTTQQQRIREMVFTDYAFFAKDDFKLTKDLTLNLGIRYEYYSPPYITSGLTSTVLDQGLGLFGVGRGVGASFDNWLQPGNLYFTGYGTNGTGARNQRSGFCRYLFELFYDRGRNICDPAPGAELRSEPAIQH